MHYVAKLTREGKFWLAEFPDCPGCQTFGQSEKQAISMAREALDGWLEAHLATGDAPPRPRRKRGVSVDVDPRIAAAVEVRWLREDSGLTQAQVAQRLRVSRQQVAKLENARGNPSIDTLSKVAKVLGRKLEVKFAV